MKFKALLILVISISTPVFSQKTELKPYTKFLQKNDFSSAKDYILEKFKEKDIVIISERDHRDMTQYELYLEVVKDQNFKGNVYTEVGCWNNYQRINSFLLNSHLTDKEKEQELLAIYRDLDYTILWEKYNYYFLLNEIYEANRNREDKDKILLFPLDLEFDWNELENYSQYKLFESYEIKNIIHRDYIMGRNFVSFFEFAKERNPERQKALVIVNTYHAYIRIPNYRPLPTRPDIYSTGEYIYKTYPETTINIYINYFTQGFNKGLTNNGLFDAAFYFTKIDNIGFDLKNTPFGSSKFDLYTFGSTESEYEKVNFDYIFDGMVFYKPVAEMKFIGGIPNVYPKEFENQFYDRITLTEGITYKEAVEQNSEYLMQINKVNKYKLEDSIIQKINKQILYWIK